MTGAIRFALMLPLMAFAACLALATAYGRALRAITWCLAQIGGLTRKATQHGGSSTARRTPWDTLSRRLPAST